MEKQYCFMRLEKIKSMGSLQHRYKHNFRKENVPNAGDPTLNEELVDKSGMDYKDMWYRRIREEEIRTGQSVAVRRGSVLAYELVMSFSRGADIDLEQWKQANVQWAKETFGEENVLSMQYHTDEETEHIHAIVVPLDKRGHLCAKSFTGGRAKMYTLQTTYGKAMQAVGLERGEHYSRANKVNIRRYYAEVESAANATAPQMLEGEQISEYMERVNEYLQKKELAALQTKNKMQRTIDVLKTQNARLTYEYQDAISLQNEITESFDGDVERARQRIRQYRDIEKAVPRKTLASLLDGILAKFPVMECVRTRRQRKLQALENARNQSEENGISEK